VKISHKRYPVNKSFESKQKTVCFSLAFDSPQWALVPLARLILANGAGIYACLYA